METLLIILIAIVIAIAGVITHGAWRWQKHTALIRSQLRATQQTSSLLLYDGRETENLPAPVRRFFQQVLNDGQPLIDTARIKTTGQFALGGIKNNWKPFHADQLFQVARPGFDWDARIQIAPGLPAFVRDAYVSGKGILHGEALALVTVADERDTPELAQGELLRHLAEMLWFPTALLPSQGVQWRAIDDTHAVATFSEGSVTVSLEFHFDATGLITSAFTPTRFRTVNGISTATPWYARYSNYARRENVLIPLQSEIEWQMPDDTLPYWRGQITQVSYEYKK